MVRSGLVTAWRFAGWPTSRSPSSVKATIEGVVRMPSAFSITLGVEPSMTATQELVVPRSMPMTFAMIVNPLFCGRSVGPEQRPREGSSCGPLAPADHPLVRPPLIQGRGAFAAVQAHIGEPYGAARQQRRSAGAL